ncbi:MAG: nucleoside hydrolase [Bacteriovoracia bacterium]
MLLGLKTIFLACTLALSGYVFATNAPGPLAVWIDADPSVGEKDRDVDDGLALLQSFHSPEIEIRGVSIVFGNTNLESALKIGKELVSRFGPKSLKVFRGASDQRDINRETEATRALTQALKRERLTILALGPATNIAAVLKQRPELKKNIAQIVAVAGRRPLQRFTTGIKNKNGHRDFNFEKDPEAFRVLLQSGVPLTLVPFEVSSKYWIESRDLYQMKSGGAGARWIVPSANQWLSLWKTTFDVDGFNPFDSLAVGFLSNPELYSCENLAAEIRELPDDVTEERMQGSNTATKPYLLVSRDVRSSFNVSYCHDAHPSVKKIIVDRVSK